VKSKKVDNVGVSPLKSEGTLHNNSEIKAEILLKQFSSVFTRDTDNNLPPLSPRTAQSITNITIQESGVLKLLQDLNISKAPGPDALPNKVLKECAVELTQSAPAVSKIFQSSLDTGQLPKD
jgi:hypothetical protein